MDVIHRVILQSNQARCWERPSPKKVDWSPYFRWQAFGDCQAWGDCSCRSSRHPRRFRFRAHQSFLGLRVGIGACCQRMDATEAFEASVGPMACHPPYSSAAHFPCRHPWMVLHFPYRHPSTVLRLPCHHHRLLVHRALEQRPSRQGRGILASQLLERLEPPASN